MENIKLLKQLLNDHEQEQFLHTLLEEAEASTNDPDAADRVILMLKERLFNRDEATLTRLCRELASGDSVPWLKSAVWQCAAMTESTASEGASPLISELFAIPLIIDAEDAPVALPQRITDRDLAIYLSQSFRDCRILQEHPEDRVLVMPRFYTVGEVHAWSPVTVHDLLHELLAPDDDGGQSVLRRLFDAPGGETANTLFDPPAISPHAPDAQLALRFLVGIHTYRPAADALWRRRATAGAVAQWQDQFAGVLDARFGGIAAVMEPFSFYPALHAGWTTWNLARISKIRQTCMTRLNLMPAEVFEVISWHGVPDATGHIPETTELHVGFFQPGPPIELIGGAVWRLTALDDAALVERHLVNEQKAAGLMGSDVLADLQPVANEQGWLIFPMDTDILKTYRPMTVGPTTRQ